MSKILKATCQNNIVKIDNFEVESEVFSEGIKESQGNALIDGDKCYYITSSASDIKDLIIQLWITLDKLIEVLNICNSGLTSAGAASAKIAELVTEITELKTQKDNLKWLI